MLPFLLLTFSFNLSFTPFNVTLFSTLLLSLGDNESTSSAVLLHDCVCLKCTLSKQRCTLFLLDINSTFPPQNVTNIPCLIFHMAFNIRRAFSCPLALVIQLLSGPISIFIIQEKCSKYEFKGSLIS